MGSRFRHSDGKTLPPRIPRRAAAGEFYPLQYGYSKGCRGRDNKCANVSRDLEVARPFSGGARQLLVTRLGSSSLERLRGGSKYYLQFKKRCRIYSRWLSRSSSNIVFTSFFPVGFVCATRWLFCLRILAESQKRLR